MSREIDKNDSSGNRVEASNIGISSNARLDRKVFGIQLAQSRFLEICSEFSLSNVQRVLIQKVLANTTGFITFYDLLMLGVDKLTEPDMQFVADILLKYGLLIHIDHGVNGESRGLSVEQVQNGSDSIQNQIRYPLNHLVNQGMSTRERNDGKVVMVPYAILLQKNWGVSLSDYCFVLTSYPFEETGFQFKGRQRKLLLYLLNDPEHIITFYDLVLLDPKWAKVRDLSSSNNLGDIQQFLEHFGLRLVMPFAKNKKVGFGIASIQEVNAEERIGDALHRRLEQSVIGDLGWESEYSKQHEVWHKVGKCHFSFPDIDLGNRTKPHVVIVRLDSEERLIEFHSREQVFVLYCMVKNFGYIDDIVLLKFSQELHHSGHRFETIYLSDRIEAINVIWEQYFPNQTLIHNLSMVAGSKGYSITENPTSREKYIGSWIEKQGNERGFWREFQNVSLEQVLFYQVYELGIKYNLYDLKSMGTGTKEKEVPWSIRSNCPYLIVILEDNSKQLVVLELAREEADVFLLFKNGERSINLKNSFGMEQAKVVQIESIMHRIKQKLKRRGIYLSDEMSEKVGQNCLLFPNVFSNGM